MFRFVTADDLRRMRLFCGYSTEKMAKKISVSHTTYKQYEAGIKQPEIGVFKWLLVYCRLGITPVLMQLRELIIHFKKNKDFKNDKTNTYPKPAKKPHGQVEQEDFENK